MTTEREPVEQDLDGGWVAEMHWASDEIQGGPSYLLIRPDDPDNPPAGGLSSTVLRSVNFREAAAQLRTRDGGQKLLADADARNYQERIERLRSELAGGVSPDYLALLSSVYLRLVSRGQPKPVEFIASDLGRGLQTVRGHLWKARKDGLLETTQGRLGGRLTPEGFRLVDAMFPSGLVSLADLARDQRVDTEQLDRR